MTIHLKTKKLYIIRHGQTDYNLKRMVQGRGIDSSLNDTGRQQSAAFFDYYKDVLFDKVYTSTLKRTWQSVEGFISKGIEHEALSGLDEISWGDHEGLVYDPEIYKQYEEVLESWSQGELDKSVGGGESPKEVVTRQKEAIDHILSSKGENILIACHGRAMRILMSWMLSYPLSKMDVFEHSNLCLYQLEVDESRICKVIKHADVRHLEG
jgi:probable phosphoglycerate mutase